MSKRWIAVIVSFVIAAVLVSVVALAVSQPAAQADRDRPGPLVPFGPRPMPMASASMAVQGDAVFVLMGPRIYKLSAKTLEVIAEGELPRPEPPEEPVD